MEDCWAEHLSGLLSFSRNAEGPLVMLNCVIINKDIVIDLGFSLGTFIVTLSASLWATPIAFILVENQSTEFVDRLQEI